MANILFVKQHVNAEFMYAPHAFTVFENDIYWHDLGASTIQSCSKMQGDARRKDLLNETHVNGTILFKFMMSL